MPEEQPICRTCKNVALNGTIDGECEPCHVQRALHITDDERMPPQQPVSGSVAINVGPQGMTIQIMAQPMNLTIGEAGMNQMVVQWLAMHPALFEELVKQRLAQKKTELAIIRDIRSTKLN